MKLCEIIDRHKTGERRGVPWKIVNDPKRGLVLEPPSSASERLALQCENRASTDFLDKSGKLHNICGYHDKYYAKYPTLEPFFV